MHRRRWVLPAVAAFLCLALSGTPAALTAADPAAEEGLKRDASGELVLRANERWASLSDFQADFDIELRFLGSPLEVTGRGWQKGRLIRMQLQVPARFLQGAAEKDATAEITLAYDGRVFWQVVPMAGMQFARRVDYERIEKELGLPPEVPSLKLPDLPYRLGEREKDGVVFHYLETEAADELIEAILFPGTDLGVALEPAARAAVWLDRETLFPARIDFHGPRDDIIRRVTFRDIRTDQDLSDEHFTLAPPEEAIVMDWTPVIINRHRQEDSQQNATRAD